MIKGNKKWSSHTGGANLKKNKTHLFGKMDPRTQIFISQLGKSLVAFKVSVVFHSYKGDFILI